MGRAACWILWQQLIAQASFGRALAGISMKQ
jgi:hypothetical protein